MTIHDEIKDLKSKQNQLKEDYQNEERRVKYIQDTMDKTTQQLHQSFYETLEDTLVGLSIEASDDIRQQVIHNYEQADQQLSDSYQKATNKVQEEWEDFQVKNRWARQELSDRLTELRRKESSDG